MCACVCACGYGDMSVRASRDCCMQHPPTHLAHARGHERHAVAAPKDRLDHLHLLRPAWCVKGARRGTGRNVWVCKRGNHDQPRPSPRPPFPRKNIPHLPELRVAPVPLQHGLQLLLRQHLRRLAVGRCRCRCRCRCGRHERNGFLGVWMRAVDGRKLPPGAPKPTEFWLLLPVFVVVKGGLCVLWGELCCPTCFAGGLRFAALATSVFRATRCFPAVFRSSCLASQRRVNSGRRARRAARRSRTQWMRCNAVPNPGETNEKRSV